MTEMSRRFKFFLSSMLVIFLIAGCIKAPEFPDIPEIELLGLSNSRMKQSAFNEDSTLVFLEFTDGDGDIGSNDSLNVFVKDLRDNFIANRYRIPYVPEAGANNGISGELTLTLYTTCCTYPNGQAPCTPSDQFLFDSISYEIYIVDRAGNESNRIVTPRILLECNTQ